MPACFVKHHNMHLQNPNYWVPPFLTLCCPLHHRFHRLLQWKFPGLSQEFLAFGSRSVQFRFLSLNQRPSYTIPTSIVSFCWPLILEFLVMGLRKIAWIYRLLFMLCVNLQLGLNYDANSLEFLMLEKERERKQRWESVVGGRKKERETVLGLLLFQPLDYLFGMCCLSK